MTKSNRLKVKVTSARPGISWLALASATSAMLACTPIDERSTGMVGKGSAGVAEKGATGVGDEGLTAKVEPLALVPPEPRFELVFHAHARGGECVSEFGIAKVERGCVAAILTPRPAGKVTVDVMIDGRKLGHYFPDNDGVGPDALVMPESGRLVIPLPMKGGEPFELVAHWTSGGDCRPAPECPEARTGQATLQIPARPMRRLVGGILETLE